MIAVEEHGEITRYLTIIEWVKTSEQPVTKPGWYFITTQNGIVIKAYAEKSLDFLVDVIAVRRVTSRPITWENGIELSEKELSELVHGNSLIFYDILGDIPNYKDRRYVVYTPEYYAPCDELFDGPIRAREHYQSIPIHRIED